MLGFIRTHSIALVALFIALSGTAYAVTGAAGVDGNKVHLRFGPGAQGTSFDIAHCLGGETVVGGGGHVYYETSGHALVVDRPFKHFGNGSQGWIAGSNGGGAVAVAICAEP